MKYHSTETMSLSDAQKPFIWSTDEMLEIFFDHPDDFLKIKETLTRIGVAGTYDITNDDDGSILKKMHLDDYETRKIKNLAEDSDKINTLTQSCYILHKKGRYYIVHFLEMFFLNGYKSTLTEKDLEYRNTIAILLSDWGLLDIAPRPEQLKCATMEELRVLRYQDKRNWVLLSKCPIGKRNNNKLKNQ